MYRLPRNETEVKMKNVSKDKIIIRNPSLLFIPALEERFWHKTSELSSKVGGFIFDLEDSIYFPAKQRARETVLRNTSVLKALGRQNVYRIIRINSARTKHYKADIELVKTLIKDLLIDVVMYSKVETGEEIDLLNKDLEIDLEAQKVPLFIVIESLSVYFHYKEILCPEKGVRWIAVGAEDLCADMGIERPVNFYSNPLLNHIATDIALYAKLKGINFWGNIWPYLDLTELLPFFIEEIATDYMMGASGKVLFHPYQIDIVDSIFKLQSKMRRKRAIISRLTALAERSAEEGLSVVLFNGRVIDIPESLKFQRLLQQLSKQEVDDILANTSDEIKSFIEKILKGHKR